MRVGRRISRLPTGSTKEANASLLMMKTEAFKMIIIVTGDKASDNAKLRILLLDRKSLVSCVLPQKEM